MISCHIQISMNAHLIDTIAVQMAHAKTVLVGFPVSAKKNSPEMEQHAQVSPS